jgi:excinuclease UvrABC nuclease subunit
VGHITVKKLLTNFNGTQDIADQTPKNISDKIGLSENLSNKIISVAKSLKIDS